MKNLVEKKVRRPTGDALWVSRQEEILEAAARLFAQHGYADTDTQLLADELGVGKGTLYRYFASKQDLFLAAVDRVMRELLQQSRPAWSASRTRWNRSPRPCVLT